MDDRQTYLLNGLLTRYFSLGRIIRFRQVSRGRQALGFELFTAAEREYLVYLYAPAFKAEDLEHSAGMVNALDAQRFSVMPFVETQAGVFVAEGPQNAHMLVALAPPGSTVGSAEFTEHDISQLGLRLAWMHRLMKEEQPNLPAQKPLAERLREAAESNGNTTDGEQLRKGLSAIEGILAMPVAQGWVHGDIQASALLLDGDHQLRVITDWGLLHAGAPLEDVVDAFLQFCMDGPGRPDAERGRSLLEAYHSLVPIDRIPWTPIVGAWCGQRLLDAHDRRRDLPAGFDAMLAQPEKLATALAACMD